MGVCFLILFLFFNIDCFASTCVKCHTPHYVKKADCVTCHRGIPFTSRKEIAHFNLITAKYASFLIDGNALRRARKIVKNANCRRCHILEGTGNLLAQDLYYTGKNKTGEYIFKMINKPNEYMPNFYFDNKTINYIVKLILFDGAHLKKQQDLSYPVFLDSNNKNIFNEKCGNCHKAILRNIGPVGKGDIGPNLSGIFSKYYKPNVLKNEKLFNEKILKRWLNNPRSFKKNGLMPPIILKKDEIKDLIVNMK